MKNWAFSLRKFLSNSQSLVSDCGQCAKTTKLFQWDWHVVDWCCVLSGKFFYLRSLSVSNCQIINWLRLSVGHRCGAFHGKRPSAANIVVFYRQLRRIWSTRNTRRSKRQITNLLWKRSDQTIAARPQLQVTSKPTMRCSWPLSMISVKSGW